MKCSSPLVYNKNKKVSLVYFVNHENNRYVGETYQPMYKRFFQEIWAGKAKKNKLTNYEQKIRKLGWFKWHIYPIRALGKNNNKTIRLRHETDCRIWLRANLNSIYTEKWVTRYKKPPEKEEDQ